jgi:aerobic-type carbon monoxide dehydrogenase small subunit (CoxS/CutS family)
MSPREIEITCTVNGGAIHTTVPSNMMLSEFVRDVLGLTGTKVSCGKGECGACTVLLNGEPVNSCLILVAQANGHNITTIEGLARDGRPTKLQQSFIEEGAIQCGYCIPGMILSAEALLRRNPAPDEEGIRRAISGNLCRCTGYAKIIRAIQKAASPNMEADSSKA